MKRVCGIYKIESPTGRVYIGQSVHVYKRWNVYKGLHCKMQSRLYRSLKKHGWDKHKVEIIEVCVSEKLNELEQYYITLYQSFNSIHGLNLLGGGKRGFKMSDETKAKIGMAHKGKIVSLETRNKLRAINLGKIWPEEHRKKLSAAHFGIPHSAERSKNKSKYQTGIKHKPHKPNIKLMKLSSDNVIKILEYLKGGKLTLVEIAKIYNVTPAVIRKVKYGLGGYGRLIDEMVIRKVIVKKGCEYLSFRIENV